MTAFQYQTTQGAHPVSKHAVGATGRCIKGASLSRAQKNRYGDTCNVGAINMIPTRKTGITNENRSAGVAVNANKAVEHQALFILSEKDRTAFKVSWVKRPNPYEFTVANGGVHTRAVGFERNGCVLFEQVEEYVCVRFHPLVPRLNDYDNVCAKMQPDSGERGFANR